MPADKRHLPAGTALPPPSPLLCRSWSHPATRQCLLGTEARWAAGTGGSSLHWGPGQSGQGARMHGRGLQEVEDGQGTPG